MTDNQFNWLFAAFMTVVMPAIAAGIGWFLAEAIIWTIESLR